MAAAGFPGIGTAARRGAVRSVAHPAGAGRVGPGRAGRSAEVVVSELVTNAVAATQRLECIPLPPVRLWLLADSTRVLIAVWDANPLLPTRSEVDELTENGRGLLLVDSLATHWEAYPTPHDGGKVVRALCATSQPADG